MYSINLKSVLTLSLLLLMTTTSGCAVAGPELKSETFFDINVHAGQIVTCHNPSDTLTIEGPTVMSFSYDGATSELFIDWQGRKVRFLPWENFSSEYPSDDEIHLLKNTIFPEVPFIDEQLAGIDEPDLHTWYSAYMEWNIVRSELEEQVRMDFAANNNSDRLAAATIVSQLFTNSELVETGSVEVVQSDTYSTDGSILLVYRGAMRDLQGVPVRTVVTLSNSYVAPVTSETTIDREDALVIHHALNSKLKTGESMLIELGTGIRVNPIGR